MGKNMDLNDFVKSAFQTRRLTKTLPQVQLNSFFFSSDINGTLMYLVFQGGRSETYIRQQLLPKCEWSTCV